MASNGEISAGDWDKNWEKLMQDNSWEFDDLVDTSRDFEGLEEWLTQDTVPQTSANDGVDGPEEWPTQYDQQTSVNLGVGARRDHSQILSPPLYAGFAGQNVIRGEELEQTGAEHMSSIAEMKSSIQALELELKEKTRRLDNLHEYVEELQPWTTEVSKLVHQLLDKQPELTTLDPGQFISNQQGPSRGLCRSTSQ